MGFKAFSIAISILVFASTSFADLCEGPSLETSLGRFTRAELPVPKGASSARLTTDLSKIDPLGILEFQVLVSDLGALATLAAPYSSPSFANQILEIEFLDLNSQVVGTACLKASVKAELVVELYGDEEEFMYYDSPEKIYLQTHEGGVLVRFVNVVDNGTEHRMHAEGAVVPHAPTDSILNEVGESYDTLMTSVAPDAYTAYYCHFHESSSDKRLIYYNIEDAEKLKERLYAQPLELP